MENKPLAELHDRFRAIRTNCTGIMGYLAMLEAGDFKGSEQGIVDDLRPYVRKLTTKLDELRDIASRTNPTASADSTNRDVIATVLSSEPKIRLSLQVLSKRLDSSVIGWPKSEWADTLRVIQGAIREVNVIHEAFGRANAA